MRKTIALALGASCLIASANPATQKANYQTIPLPQQISAQQGTPFVMSAYTVIAYPKGNTKLKRNAELLASYIFNLTGTQLPVVDNTPKSNAIILKNDLKSDNAEAYNINISPEFITINGSSPAGNFYGCQTLRKSIPQQQIGLVEFPCATISDQPRFEYRGAHFDVGRHFFPVDSVKSFIDMIALHNINRLHWHLTEDQGWRLEIKSRPELTTKGSIRPAP